MGRQRLVVLLVQIRNFEEKATFEQKQQYYYSSIDDY
jgi:hypothetical protein